MQGSQTSMKFQFFLIDFFIVLAPLLLSVFIKMQFYRKWKFTLLGISVTTILFILWDMFFTRLGIRDYHAERVWGLTIYNLPVEAILFYIVTAYTCLYIYECLRVYFPDKGHPLLGNIFGWLVVAGSGWTIWFYFDQVFASITAILLLVTYLNHLWVTRGDYLWHLMYAWVITSIPMGLVYGLLFGLPITSFQPEFIIGIRLGPIPVEIFFYHLLFITWIIWVYERYKQRPYWRELAREDEETGAETKSVR